MIYKYNSQNEAKKRVLNTYCSVLKQILKNNIKKANVNDERTYIERFAIIIQSRKLGFLFTVAYTF